MIWLLALAGATVWEFITLGLFEAYFKEWAVKFARWYGDPILSSIDKAKILPNVDHILLTSKASFQDAAKQALLESGKTLVNSELEKALYEISDTFDINIYREKLTEAAQ